MLQELRWLANPRTKLRPCDFGAGGLVISGALALAGATAEPVLPSGAAVGLGASVPAVATLIGIGPMVGMCSNVALATLLVDATCKYRTKARYPLKPTAYFSVASRTASNARASSCTTFATAAYTQKNKGSHWKITIKSSWKAIAGVADMLTAYNHTQKPIKHNAFKHLCYFTYLVVRTVLHSSWHPSQSWHQPPTPQATSIAHPVCGQVMHDYSPHTSAMVDKGLHIQHKHSSNNPVNCITSNVALLGEEQINKF